MRTCLALALTAVIAIMLAVTTAVALTIVRRVCPLTQNTTGGNGSIAVFAVLMGDTPLSPLIDTLNGLFLAVPDFIWAFALVLLFGVFAPILPLSGRIDPSLDTDFVTPFYLIESLLTLRFAIFFDVLKHMIMPILALGIPLAAVITRVLRVIGTRPTVKL